MEKEQQKKLLSEIMEADQKNGLYHIGDTNKMVTAVEWFYQKIRDSRDGFTFEELSEWRQQAKQIHKEQIINAWLTGETFLNDDNDSMHSSVVWKRQEAEAYYDRIFKKL